MKRIIFIAILGLLAFTGCKKEPFLAELLCGEWRGSELSVDAGIYIRFAADGTFELYQKMGTEGFELRRGNWALAGDILSGTYNDGEPWAASYKASVKPTGEVAQINAAPNIDSAIIMPPMVIASIAFS